MADELGPLLFTAGEQAKLLVRVSHMTPETAKAAEAVAIATYERPVRTFMQYFVLIIVLVMIFVLLLFKLNVMITENTIIALLSMVGLIATGGAVAGFLRRGKT